MTPPQVTPPPVTPPPMTGPPIPVIYGYDVVSPAEMMHR
jgi:hypothetical protein